MKHPHSWRFATLAVVFYLLIGVSTSRLWAQITITGSNIPQVNGTYNASTLLNGKKYYTNASGAILQWALANATSFLDRWEIVYMGVSYHTNGVNSLLPPCATNGEWVANNAANGVITVSGPGCNSPSFSITGSTTAQINGDYILTVDQVNGKNVYDKHPYFSFFSSRLQARWSGTDWEIGLVGGFSPALYYTNTASTSLPPCSNISAWTPTAAIGNITLTGTGCESVLPVVLVHFGGYQAEIGISLNWQTSLEINHDGFWIERSRDATTWEILDFVASRGDSPNGQMYSLKDSLPFSGMNYYRLRQLDLDGTTQLLAQTAIHFQVDRDMFSVYPNPTTEHLHLRLDRVQPTARTLGQLSIVSTTGEVVERVAFPYPYSRTISLAKLLPGAYTASLIWGGKVFVHRFVKV